MKVNWINPPSVRMKQDELMITDKDKMINEERHRKEVELLNHFTVNCAKTSSSQIISFQKYWYLCLNQKMPSRINPIKNTLISKLYASQPPTNMLQMCNIARRRTSIKEQ